MIRIAELPSGLEPADSAAKATLTRTGNYAPNGFASSTNASGMTVITYA
ncbi:MAG: hypothetical protein ACLPN5_18700 [Roseiarcus sp.]